MTRWRTREEVWFRNRTKQSKHNGQMLTCKKLTPVPHPARVILRKHNITPPIAQPRAVRWPLVGSRAVAGVKHGDKEHQNAKKESDKRVFTHHPTTIETEQLRREQSIREGGESGTSSKESNAFAWRETHLLTGRRPPPVRCRRIPPRPAQTGAPAPAWAMTAARTLARRTCMSNCWRARLGPRRLLGRRTRVRRRRWVS